MKTVLKTLAIAFISSTLALAGNLPESFKVNMYSVNNQAKVKVFVENLQNESIDISVKDLKGNILSNTFVPKKVKHSGMVLDLSALEKGNYIIELQSKSGKVSKTLKIDKAQVTPSSSVVLL